jgi:hypothetical protein
MNPKQRILISNELNDDGWDLKKMIEANPTQPSELVTLIMMPNHNMKVKPKKITTLNF